MGKVTDNTLIADPMNTLVDSPLVDQYQCGDISLRATN